MIIRRILAFFMVFSLLAPTNSFIPVSAATSEDMIVQDMEDAVDDSDDADSDTTWLDPAASEEEEKYAEADDTIAERTILMYICGADLESFSGMATYNLEQILHANFSRDDKIRFLVMTGGSSYYKWWLDKSYLSFPEGMPEEDEISIDYNQIWEAKGADAGDLASKLVLLDGDGVMGDGDLAKTSEEELMSDPETLKAFINYGVNQCPAKKYDLILWDHGGGPVDGFAYDEHDPDYENINLMSFSKIIDAISDNDVIRNGGSNDGKFDFIDFDACLMNSAELILGLEAYTDYYIASAETEPGGGQDYSGWLSLLGETPDMNAYALGTFLVDDYIKAYASDDYNADVTLAVVNMKKIMDIGLTEALTSLNETLKSQVRTAAADGKYFYYDELDSSKGSIRYGEGSYSYLDLGNLVSQLAVAKKELGLPDPETPGVFHKLNSYEEVSAKLQDILEDGSAIYSRSTDAIRADARVYMDKDHMLQYKDLSSSGMSIYFPKLADTNDTAAYYDAMQEAADATPNENSRAFLKDYSATMVDYALLVETGKAVCALTDAGVPKNEINFERCIQYWQSTKGSMGGSLWNDNISLLLARCAGGQQEAAGWLNELALQMAGDAVSPDHVQGVKMTSNGSEIYKVTISDTDKRVIEGVKMNVIAELPAAKQYLIDNGFYSGKAEDYSEEFDFRTATVKGKEDINGLDIDIARDSGEVILHKIQQWYDKAESVWDFEVPSKQVYALKDAHGVLHAVETEFDDSGRATTLISYPDPYYLTKYNRNIAKKAALVFENAGGEYVLSDIYLNYPKDARPVKVSDLSEEVTDISACYRIILYGGTIDFYIPTGDTAFTVSKENADSIRLVATDINEIPDIADTTGDGEAIHRDVVVEDIFDYEMNINAKINDRSAPTPQPQPEPEKPVDKSNSRVTLKAKTAIYSGKNIPIDTAKVEGSGGKVTYVYYSDSSCTKKVNKHKDAGTYYVKAFVAEDEQYKSAVSNTAKLIIKPKAIKPKVKLNKTTFKYNGKAKKPKVTVKWGKKILKAKRDYTLTYSPGRKKRGTYKVKVKLKGNFSGRGTKKFRIK